MKITNDETGMVARAEKGDLDAFAALWECHLHSLELAVLAMTRNRDEADDVLQDAWIKASQAISSGRYDHTGRFVGWIYTIARRIVIDHARQSSRETEISEETLGKAVASDSTDREAITGVLIEALERELSEALGTKIEQQSPDANLKVLAFILYYGEGCSPAEVLDVISAESERIGIKSPGSAVLNNWLSGQRLMARLVNHLLADHAELLEKLEEQTVEQARLTPEEARIWRDRRAGPPNHGTADFRLLARAQGKLANVLTAQIHFELRRGSIRADSL